MPTLPELAAALQLPPPSAHMLEHRVDGRQHSWCSASSQYAVTGSVRVLVIERDHSGESDGWVAQVGDVDNDGDLVDPSCFEVEDLDELLDVKHWVDTGVRVAACPSCHLPGVNGRCTDGRKTLLSPITGSFEGRCTAVGAACCCFEPGVR